MYKKQSENKQMTLDDFILPFSGKLSAENRWVKLAKLMPWDLVEDIYSAKFKNERSDGNIPIPARVAFGALYIKADRKLTDEMTVENIAENPFMQYFLGLHEFTQESLFDPSMMVHFRKRFSEEEIAKINEELYRRTHPPKDDMSRGGTPQGNDNEGTLVLDATCAPADVRYPTDLSLLNECRENAEKLIDKVWDSTSKTGHKTSYNRKKARKQYLKVAKQRKPKRKAVKKAVSEQLEYVEKSLADIDKLLIEVPENILTVRQKKHLDTVRKVAAQQREHAENPQKSISDRIVNLRQPHVRPIVRGKAGAPVEFGQKLNFSVVDGFTFIDNQSFDNFNEGITLVDSAKKYRERHGCWPEAILADTIYRNRENRKFCREHGIRLSGRGLADQGSTKLKPMKRKPGATAVTAILWKAATESQNGVMA